ncbi:MAG: spondin domain-containing protein, partial [Planctomycetota bacterium]
MQSKMIAFAVVAAAGTGALAQNIEVTFENLQAPGGLSFTPLWLGLGDGSFDVFTPGSSSETPAFDGITQIAEVGDTAAITSRFDAEQAAGSQTTLLEPNGPPVFSPGESATATLNSSDASIYRFLNFASMVVPSNDLFVG